MFLHVTVLLYSSLMNNEESKLEIDDMIKIKSNDSKDF